MTSALLVDVDHQGAIGVDRAVTQESVEPELYYAPKFQSGNHGFRYAGLGLLIVAG